MSSSSAGGGDPRPGGIDATHLDEGVGVMETLTTGDPAGATAAATPSPEIPAPARTRPARATALATGMMVGEYKVEAKLGEGGMGAVYGAVHPLIGKRAAIKVLKRELCSNPEAVERFVLEARSVNQIGHPNIVDIFSFGELADGRSYFVMEWLRGESLGQRLHRGRLTFGECLEILDGVLRGLEAAHDKGIIHRDLKPDNVYLVEVRGERPSVKLLDFGIAKLTGGEDNRLERTRTGALIGTPQYIAPEQARGFAIDHRADIYSLGVMAFEMFTGRPPFQAETAMDMISKHLNEAPPRPSTVAPLPAVLDEMIFDMLEKDPGNRPELARIREIIEEIRSASVNVALRGTVPDATLPPAVAAQRRRRSALMIAGVVVVLTAGIGGFLALRSDDDPGPVAAAPPPASTPVPTPDPIPTPPPPDPVPTPPPAVAMGALKLTISGGEPDRITVDGADVEPTRRLSLELPAGPHRIEITAPGRKPATFEATLVAGTTLDRKVTLSKSSRDRPTGTGSGSGSAVGAGTGTAASTGKGSGSATRPPPDDDDDGVIDPFRKKKPTP